MRKYILVIMFALLLFPETLKADCSYSENLRLKKLAGNITTTYDYKEQGDGIIFSITISNLNPELYIYDDYMGRRYDYNETGEITLSGYSSGYSIKYDVYTTNESCSSPFLIAHYVNLPSYNFYHKDPLCSETPSYSLCQKWAKINMTSTQFEKAVNEYKESLKKPGITENEVPPENNIINNIVEFIIEYWYFMTPVVLIIGGVVVWRVRKTNRFGL